MGKLYAQWKEFITWVNTLTDNELLDRILSLQGGDSYDGELSNFLHRRYYYLVKNYYKRLKYKLPDWM